MRVRFSANRNGASAPTTNLGICWHSQSRKRPVTGKPWSGPPHTRSLPTEPLQPYGRCVCLWPCPVSSANTYMSSNTGPFSETWRSSAHGRRVSLSESRRQPPGAAVDPPDGSFRVFSSSPTCLVYAYIGRAHSTRRPCRGMVDVCCLSCTCMAE